MLSGPLCLSLLIPQLPFSLVLYPSFLVVASALICLLLEDYATVRNPVSHGYLSLVFKHHLPQGPTLCPPQFTCPPQSLPLSSTQTPPPRPQVTTSHDLSPLLPSAKKQLVHYHKGSLSFPDQGPAFLPLTYAFWSHVLNQMTPVVPMLAMKGTKPECLLLEEHSPSFLHRR